MLVINSTSVVTLNAPCTILNISIGSSDTSNTVQATLDIIQNGSLVVEQGSTFVAFGSSIGITDNAQLNSKSLNIQGSISLLGQSSVISSIITLNGSFIVDNGYQTISANITSIGNSNISINNSQTTFTSLSSIQTTDQSTLKVTNSILSLDGKSTFNSSATITNTTIELHGNHLFGSQAVLELVDTTLNVYPTTNITINNILRGKRLTLNLEGNMYFAKSVGTFECDNCTITIKGKGLFRFNLFSKANITNSVIYNNANVFIAAKMLIPFGNKIINTGTLDYCADIFIDAHNNTVGPNDDNIITNTGRWLCNTPMHNLLSTPFLNTGSLEFTRGNVTFNRLHQTNGSITLAGGKLYANNTIELYAGSIIGKGEVYGSINNQGSMGNINNISATDNITIHGDLGQLKGEITFNIHTNDTHSQVAVANQFNATDTNVNIFISQSISENTTVDIMTFGSFVGSVPNFKVSTFDPNTGKVTTVASDDCRYKTSMSGRSISVLVAPNDKCVGASNNQSDSFPIGAIIGIVVGVVALATLITLGMIYRTKIRLMMKKSYASKSVKMTSKEEDL
ncbi:hypothetical protein SAMD00019534_048850 [Acytostelium subglobosum LB1]|uniref:hypothetical protein n=1 Tax=Acytostelium subglobosum LB1 TaxID=1410327 RepID=UPI000644F43D|nr:hypothetical protein SAMD00019534_048850 [Acytostelium subglobosum LB1]GAM21710.1 hypothetical protein SAMD00019534_048850 [Acytostelium subglobosum LB1]|eukprot:XP_012755829.1 hypothetical protein SAMD00019534_048850 [Acytostelium subglobosum LB1]